MFSWESVNIYKNLYSPQKTCVSPQQKSTFSLKHIFYRLKTTDYQLFNQHALNFI